jgi:hypothetical protein
VVVVLGHFQHAFARHVPPAQHIFQKRHDVVRPFRTAERHNQQRVVFHSDVVSAE